MTQPDYDQKKCECFVKFCKDNGIDQEVNISIFDAFDQIFDRAYALGREKETITQEEIESHSVEYATDVNNARLSACPEAIRPQLYPEYEMDDLANAFEAGANFSLGKQFGNSEQVDAEGEEMLTVSRKKLMDAFNSAKIIGSSKMSSKMLAGAADMCINTFKDLFGPKCLPDNVESSEDNVESLPQNPTENCDNKSHISADCNKPAEPKFTKGDMVHCKSFGYEGDYKVLEYTGGPRNCYDCIDKYGAYYRFYESDLEPYTEPTDLGREVNFPTKSNLAIYLKKSKNCDNRLQIAAMAMQGILSNENAIQYAINNFRLQDGSRNRYQAVAECSLAFADALIAESEKRSEHGK